jgi:hypothetical protein
MTETSFPDHVILLVRHGIHSIESLYLEQLAKNSVYAFTFISYSELIATGLRGSASLP